MEHTWILVGYYGHFLCQDVAQFIITLVLHAIHNTHSMSREHYGYKLYSHPKSENFLHHMYPKKKKQKKLCKQMFRRGWMALI